MQPSDTPSGDTTGNTQKSSDRSNVKIHNILPSIERTFLQIGSTIGKYCIIEEIDRGGMAVVYKALQLDLDREVALKVLPANITINRRFVDRFLSEAHAVAKLQHPFIVNIHEVAVENNVYFLAMDFIPGMNLYYHLNFQKPKLVDVLEITVKLADALAYAHNQKIIHRDLKLNNIIMRDNVTPVLIDFGLAKALEGEDVALTKTGEIMGSPAYMAPERLAGTNTDARSDICSLGIMLYEMLTFKNPYLDPRSMPQTTMNVMEANPILPRKLVPWLPVEIEAITLKAMHKDPEKRYQTMEEFRDDVKRYQKGEPVLANPPSIWTKGKHFLHVYWTILVIGLLVAAFSSLFVFSMYINKKKEKPFWRLSYTENFASVAKAPWSVLPYTQENEALHWTIRGHALRSPAQGFSYIACERSFSREMRIAFDVRCVGEDFGHAGFFLFGKSPDSAYCFHIHRGRQALCGVSYPGSDFLFADYNPVNFVAGRQYHVDVEYRENEIKYKINTMVIAEIRDYFGPAGPQHQQLGFFTDNTLCEFTNVRVSTYTQSLVRSPLVAGDRFAARGEYAEAISEYREILPDFAGASEANDILLKMCECRIRQRQYGPAMLLLEQYRRATAGKPVSPARGFFLEGMAYAQQAAMKKADSCFVELFKSSPDSPLGQSAAAAMIIDAVKGLRRGDAEYAAGELALLNRSYRGLQKARARAYLMLLDYFVSRGAAERVKSTADSIALHFKTDEDVQIAAQVELSRSYLANGNKSQAVEMLNRCVATYVPSEEAWSAWMELAEIYEFDGNFMDAFTIYKKIFTDAPKWLISSWIARIRMGEIADRVTTDERPETVFDDVVSSPHPFALPRRIARFYKGDISEEELESWWTSVFPGNKEYLDYFAKKALMDKDQREAGVYWEELKQGLSPNTWAAVRINKSLSLLKQ